MSETTEPTIERLEEQLERAERTLSGLRPLDQDQARRVAERMERLNSQLLALSGPPSLRDAHDRMGTEPAGAEEFGTLAEEMGSPDGEG
ncbi:MAG: hypothetical protein ACRDMA_15540 [Solirubrobacterales bacterium]